MHNPNTGIPLRTKRKVTVRDIAAEVGIHFTTVAAALRNSPKVKDATKDKVNRVAKRLGYRADPMLTALSAYRTETKTPTFQGVLAWINLFNSPNYFSPNYFDEPTNGFYLQSFKGAVDRAESLGYHLESFWMAEPGMTVARASQILESRNVAGLIVPPLPHGIDVLDLVWEKFCSVRIGYSLEDSDLTTVSADQFGNMKRLFKKLLNDGFRRIGFASPKRIDNRTNNHWSGAFCAMQLRHFDGKGIKPHLSETKKEGFIEWFRENRPEVIISSVFETHMQLLRDHGIKVPQDTQVVSLHVDADNFDSPVSGIQQNSVIVGKTSVDHLVAIIHRSKAGIETHPKTVSISGDWQDGASYDPSLLSK